MADHPRQFALQSRVLHWLMAAILVAMLFIGVAMVSSLGITTGLLRSTGHWEF
jgi:cytochrome b561